MEQSDASPEDRLQFLDIKNKIKESFELHQKLIPSF
jgi:hypothetical protein